MDTGLSNWNGYAVHGDVKELDVIVETQGYINLDKDDVHEVLSAEGDNWVATGTDKQIAEAFTKALNNLPFPVDKINSLLISFRCGDKQPVVTEFSLIPQILSKANHSIDVKWGMAKDDNMIDSFKVILVASANR